MPNVKICGITTREAVRAACEARAAYVGFVFHTPSPRFIEPWEAGNLSRLLTPHTKPVGLFVDPTNEQIKAVLRILPLSIIQLHGSESLERVREIRMIFKIPVMKAIPVGSFADLAEAQAFERVADWLLFDKKSKTGAHGGSGQAFDWGILKLYKHRKPWMLAGGLHAGNIHEACHTLNPPVLDVSSGVEDRPGEKNPDLIKEFIEIARRNG